MSEDYTLHHGDCLEELRAMPDASVDAVVTDPPYGLSNTKPAQVADVLAAWVTGDTEAVPAKRGGFMGKDWDSFVPPPAVWAECMRVLKPGGHLAVFAGARTQDLMGLSVRLAGFEIRDTLGWIYGSGMPKSHNVGKAIGKAADTAASEAERWDGWGTALKPAIEPIILARKPLDGTVANNVLAHGVGGLNIDASRVGSGTGEPKPEYVANGKNQVYGAGMGGGAWVNTSGRWPANVLLDEHAAAEVDKQSGVSKSQRSVRKKAGGNKGGRAALNSFANHEDYIGGHNDSGGASRFFPVFKYQAKAPTKERPVIVREDGTKVQHPTVKPVALMEWLVALVAPPGGVVLDPFAGSGATLEAASNKGMHPVGVEQSADYCALIRERMD